MTKFTIKTKGTLLSVTISLMLLLFFYHANIFHLNKYLFSNHDDGLKSYYNFVWHGKYDTSLTKLNSTAYPYGEFILYEGSSPFFNNTKLLVSRVFPKINNYSVGILNMLVFLSYLIGSIFMYLIFLRFSLPYYLSAISANAVILLSSQILLLNPAGHFWLSLVCFFPIGWYLIIKYYESRNKIKWSLLIAINIFIWTFVHVYLAIIIILFVASVYLFKVIFDRKIYLTKKYISEIIIQLFLPAIITLTLYKTMDSHSDRIDMPFLTSYIATLNSIFLSKISPFSHIYSLVFNLDNNYNYRWGKIGNYIGIIANISIVIAFIKLIILIFKKQYNKIKKYFYSDLSIFILSSIVLLILSLAIPLKFFPVELIDKLPVIKQFSSTGRFAWAFYFVITTFSIVFFYNILYKLKWGKAVIYFILLITFIEGFSYHLKISKQIKKSPNPFSINYLPEKDKILTEVDSKKFQAILPLPYFFKYNLPFRGYNIDSSVYASFIASAYSGLPIFSIFLSRPSVSEALSIFKMLMPLPYQKNIKTVVDDGRDMAVIINNYDTALLMQNEKNLLKKCKPYMSNAYYTILSLPIKKLIEQNKSPLLNEYHKSKLLYKNGWLINDTNCFVYYNSFDTIKSDIYYKGAGALKGKKRNYTVAGEFLTQKMDTSTEYSISFWYYNYIWDQTFNSAIITEVDSTNKTLQWLQYSPISTTIIIDGWWYFSEYKFKPLSNHSKIKILFHGSNKFKEWFAVDELLIRPANINIYRVDKNSKTIYCNNKVLVVGG